MSPQVLSNHFIWRKATYKVWIQREHILTLGCWEVGLGNALGHTSSFTRDGRVGSVGVSGWKLVGVGGSEAVEGDDSSSFWRSLIFCSSSLRYSIASPRMEALSIYQLQTETISSLAGQTEKLTLVIWYIYEYNKGCTNKTKGEVLSTKQITETSHAKSTITP